MVWYTGAERRFRPIRPDIEQRDGLGHGVQSMGFFRQPSAKLDEELLLEGQQLDLGSGDTFFQFFQFRRHKSLGIDQRLLADIVGRDSGKIGFGDLDIVAEDLIVADLQ